MEFTILIPARLASTRLPNKPLADIAGKAMIVRVAERARDSGAARVVVACDDARVHDACAAAGIEALLTRVDHANGSERLAEACERLELDAGDLVVNVQGDEPLLDPQWPRSVAELLGRREDCVMSTAAHPIEDESEFLNPNVVKVVLDRDGTAMYFSRAPIPCWRDAPAAGAKRRPAPQPLRHVGLYAYRAGFLRAFAQLPPAPLEELEALEQLRALWHGHRIAVHLAPAAPAPGVDTPADLERVRRIFAGRA